MRNYEIVIYQKCETGEERQISSYTIDSKSIKSEMEHLDYCVNNGTFSRYEIFYT